jgi:anti-sigma regulatory factor (Ser/Thr protein kinase)
MSHPAPLDLHITSDPGALPTVRDAVRKWTTAAGWSNEQIEEIVLALDEALTNVIRHGYGSRPGEPIEVAVAGCDDPDAGAGVEIQVRDFGRQVDPSQICGRDLDDVRPGGLGVHIIRSMNNSVEYQCAPGGGMLLVMRKYKTHRASDGCDSEASRHE